MSAAIERGELILSKPKPIMKKGNRRGLYHYTKIEGDGYWVTLCGRIINNGQVQSVFEPKRLCDRCRELN